MVTPFGLSIAKHIKSDSVADIFPGAHAVDGFLHLAVTTVAAFHSVGSRREQLIVEEGECLFQVGAEEFLEGLAELLEAVHPAAELGQLLQGRLAPAAAVKEPVDLVHDLPQRTQLGVPATYPGKRLPFARGQGVLDEEVAVVEQIGDFLPQSVLGAGFMLCCLRRRTTAGKFGDLRGERLTHLSDGLEHRLGDLGDDMEFADLVRYGAEDLGNRRGIER